jgi:hypothetical protein
MQPTCGANNSATPADDVPLGRAQLAARAQTDPSGGRRRRGSRSAGTEVAAAAGDGPAERLAVRAGPPPQRRSAAGRRRRSQPGHQWGLGPRAADLPDVPRRLTQPTRQALDSGAQRDPQSRRPDDVRTVGPASRLHPAPWGRRRGRGRAHTEAAWEGPRPLADAAQPGDEYVPPIHSPTRVLGPRLYPDGSPFASCGLVDAEAKTTGALIAPRQPDVSTANKTGTR